MDERKKRIIRFFATAYIVFGAFIIYLMFLNTGISISAKPGSSSEIEITVKNSSMHLITNIDLFLINNEGFEKKIITIEALKPSEEKTIQISEEQTVNGKIKFKAQAPYHLSVLKEIKIEKESSGEIKIDIEAPAKTFIETKTSITIIICNLSSQASTAEIESQFDSKYFSNRIEPKTITLESGKCIEQKLELIPISKGKTTIVFNIKTETVSKRFEKEIEIIE